MNTPYCVITDAGREIMRGVNVSGTTVKSDPFTFTKIMLGCGTYTAEQKTESALRVMTALRTPKNNYPISSVKRVNASNNLYKVSAIATNYNVATGTILVANGYNVTEIGKEAFKGCEQLSEVVAPKVRVRSMFLYLMRATSSL